eukprot:XP_025002503.1 uncharacterized protein LOC112531526 [Gallus gallus]
MLWANSGTWSILFVPNVKSHSWVTVIMREKAWHIVRPTTIRAMDLHRDGVGIEKQVLYSCLLCTLPQRMAAMRDVFLVSYLQRWAGPLAILTSPSVPAEET